MASSSAFPGFGAPSVYLGGPAATEAAYTAARSISAQGANISQMGATDIFKKVYGLVAASLIQKELDKNDDLRSLFDKLDATKQCEKVIGPPFIDTYIDKLNQNVTKAAQKQVKEITTKLQAKKAEPGRLISTTCWLCGLPIDEQKLGFTSSECEHVLPVIQAVMFYQLYNEFTDTKETEIKRIGKAITEKIKIQKQLEKKKAPVAAILEELKKLNTDLKNTQLDYDTTVERLKLIYRWAHAGCNRLKNDMCFISRGIIPPGLPYAGQAGLVVNDKLIDFYFQSFFTTTHSQVAPVRDLVLADIKKRGKTQLVYINNERLIEFKKVLVPLCNKINSYRDNLTSDKYMSNLDQICSAGAANLLSTSVVSPKYQSIISKILSNISLHEQSNEFTKFLKEVRNIFAQIMISKFQIPIDQLPPKFQDFIKRLSTNQNQVPVLIDRLIAIFDNLILYIYIIYHNTTDNKQLTPEQTPEQPIPLSKPLSPIEFVNLTATYCVNLFMQYTIQTPASNLVVKNLNEIFIINGKSIKDILTSTHIFTDTIASLKTINPASLSPIAPTTPPVPTTEAEVKKEENFLDKVATIEAAQAPIVEKFKVSVTQLSTSPLTDEIVNEVTLVNNDTNATINEVKQILSASTPQEKETPSQRLLDVLYIAEIIDAILAWDYDTARGIIQELNITDDTLNYLIESVNYIENGDRDGIDMFEQLRTIGLVETATVNKSHNLDKPQPVTGGGDSYKNKYISFPSESYKEEYYKTRPDLLPIFIARLPAISDQELHRELGNLTSVGIPTAPTSWGRQLYNKLKLIENVRRTKRIERRNIRKTYDISVAGFLSQVDPDMAKVELELKGISPALAGKEGADAYAAAAIAAAEADKYLPPPPPANTPRAARAAARAARAAAEAAKAAARGGKRYIKHRTNRRKTKSHLDRNYKKRTQHKKTIKHRRSKTYKKY